VREIPSVASIFKRLRTELIVALFLLVANGRYDLAIKKTLKATGGVGFTYPAHVPGQVYTVGEEVSHRG
jgi:hypothetical protein